MRKETPIQTDSRYKISAIIGVLIVTASSYICWQHISHMEAHAEQTFEQTILAKLDLESLIEQLNSIKFAINQSQVQESEQSVDYSASELQTLQEDADILRNHINEQMTTLATLDLEKHAIVTELKITLIIGVTTIVAGMVIAIFGFMAWYFHIQILEDRRTQPRE